MQARHLTKADRYVRGLQLRSATLPGILLGGRVPNLPEERELLTIEHFLINKGLIQEVPWSDEPVGWKVCRLTRKGQRMLQYGETVAMQLDRPRPSPTEQVTYLHGWPLLWHRFIQFITRAVRSPGTYAVLAVCVLLAVVIPTSHTNQKSEPGNDRHLPIEEVRHQDLLKTYAPAPVAK